VIDETDLQTLLGRAAAAGAGYRATLGNRPVAPRTDVDALRGAFGGQLPAAFIGSPRTRESSNG